MFDINKQRNRAGAWEPHTGLGRGFNVFPEYEEHTLHSKTHKVSKESGSQIKNISRGFSSEFSFGPSKQ